MTWGEHCDAGRLRSLLKSDYSGAIGKKGFVA
jgi:hypothetical protein